MTVHSSRVFNDSPPRVPPVLYSHTHKRDGLGSKKHRSADEKCPEEFYSSFFMKHSFRIRGGFFFPPFCREAFELHDYFFSLQQTVFFNLSRAALMYPLLV